MRSATLTRSGIKSGREGGNPFFLSAGDTDAEKDVAGSAFMAAPSRRDVAWWFFTLSVRCRVRAVPCIHRSRAVVDTRVRWRRCGHPVLPSRQPRSSGRSLAQVFTVSPSSSRLPCASGCGFPCALVSPTDRPTGMDARHRPVSRNM